MRWVLWAAAIVGAGCCPVVAYEEVEGPPGWEEATALIRADYREIFGRDRTVRIRWFAESPHYFGQSYDCKAIWVLRRSDRPSETSLAHELAHCYAGHIRHCGLMADDSHSEAWIWGASGLVDYANRELLAPRGL